ncbi:UBX domain-containing protein 11 [Podargus strigoides]
MGCIAHSTGPGGLGAARRGPVAPWGAAEGTAGPVAALAGPRARPPAGSPACRGARERCMPGHVVLGGLALHVTKAEPIAAAPASPWQPPVNKIGGGALSAGCSLPAFWGHTGLYGMVTGSETTPARIKLPKFLTCCLLASVPSRYRGYWSVRSHTEDDRLSPRTKNPVQGSLSSRSKGTTLKKNMQGEAHADAELVSSMMQKITLLEQKIEKQAQEIQLKDRRIAELEEKMKTLQKGEDALDSSSAEELEIRCLQLQTQVWEMEQFLNDYGLIWVGERHEQLEDLESLKDEEELSARRLWKPDEAVADHHVDFDLILEKVKDLNVLAGEGISHIEHTPGGARLRQPEPLPLTLYQNGIVMFNGPFRPYEDPSTQQCLQDIMDGYFPSELQMRYPDGIPLQVTDRRDVVFQERHLPGSFPGPGQVVGHSKSSEVQETTKIPGPKLSLERLNKLSKSLKHGREAMDVQDSARAAQQGSGGVQSSKEILEETPRLSAVARVKTAEEAEGSGPDVCTLRIKSESGEQTYIVKMLFTETIGDLRQHLAHARGGDSNSYEIISTFPQRVYTDNTRSLQECGLIPNAFLLLRRRDPSQQEGTGLQTA